MIDFNSLNKVLTIYRHYGKEQGINAFKDYVIANFPKIELTQESIDSALVTLNFGYFNTPVCDQTILVSEQLTEKAMSVVFSYLKNIGSSNVQEIGCDGPTDRNRLTKNEIIGFIGVLLMIIQILQAQLQNSKPNINIINPTFIIEETKDDSQINSLINDVMIEFIDC